MMAMRDPDYSELRGRGLIDTGQEMLTVAANYPAGPKVVKILSIEPMYVWVQLSDKDWTMVAGKATQ